MRNYRVTLPAEIDNNPFVMEAPHMIYAKLAVAQFWSFMKENLPAGYAYAELEPTVEEIEVGSEFVGMDFDTLHRLLHGIERETSEVA